MENQEQKAEAQQPAGNPGEGNQSAAVNPIDRADSILKGLDEKIKKYEDLVKRSEDTAARIILAGKADAGSKIKTQEEIDKEKVEAEVKRSLAQFSRR